VHVIVLKVRERETVIGKQQVKGAYVHFSGNVTKLIHNKFTKATNISTLFFLLIFFSLPSLLFTLAGAAL